MDLSITGTAPSLYAALNTRTGTIVGQTVPRHTSAAFIDFWATSWLTVKPRRREIHVIVDNLSAHKTKAVSAYLEAHPRVHLHYTPTYASWLYQVELWFGKISETCWPGASSPRCRTSPARSDATSRATTRTRNHPLDLQQSDASHYYSFS